MLIYLVSVQLSDRTLPTLFNWKSSDFKDDLNKSSGNVTLYYFFFSTRYSILFAEVLFQVIWHLQIYIFKDKEELQTP